MDDAKLVAASAIALAVTLFSIFSMRPLARRMGLVDRPDARKCHRGRVPLIGGLCFFLGTIAGLLYLGYIDRFVAGLLVPCALIVMTGAVDDLHNLSVRSRLVIQTCAAGLVIAATGVYLDDTGQVFGNGGLHLGLAGIPITIIAVIGLINAFNMLDGIDGLAASLAMVSIGSIMLFSGAGLPTLGVMLLLQVLFASLVPYLFVNLGWPDGRKIFMGDAGSTLIGFLLGWSLIFLSHKGVQRLQPVDALWCVALPVMDTLAVMFRRMRKRLSPFKPDRQHLHHLLQDTGCSPRTTLAAIVSASGALALTGYALRDAPEMLSGGVFVALLVVYVLRFQRALEWLCTMLRGDQALDARLPARIAEAASAADVPQRAAIRTLCVMATPADAIRIAPIARQLSRDARFDAKVCVAAQRDQTPVQVLSLFDMQPDMQLRVIARPGQPEDITSMTLGGMKRVLRDFKPDVIVVPSDASATLATTLAAFYQQIPVVCIESDAAGHGAGRRLDHAGHRIASELASLHFISSESSREQLRDGGVPAERIVVSGNPAMGTLRTAAERIRHDATLSRDLAQCFAFLRSGSPLLLVADGASMHFNGADPFDVEPIADASHPRHGAAISNFAFEPVCRALRKIAMRRPDVDIVYPLNHPASARIDALLRACPNIHLVSPTDYLSFAYLLHNATVVLSDASELAAEMTAMGKRVLLVNDGSTAASTPRTALHEQAIAAGVLGLLNLRGSDAPPPAAVEGGRDTCERIVDALAGFASHAGLSARPRQAPTPAVAAAVEALREAS
jgi:undecaprenyl-phosphate alpha-N-acetylglucosaminyl 1-phosphatetransferase/UDP-N-acetylglucosamine 2-epimerase